MIYVVCGYHQTSNSLEMLVAYRDKAKCQGAIEWYENLGYIWMYVQEIPFWED